MENRWRKSSMSSLPRGFLQKGAGGYRGRSRQETVEGPLEWNRNVVIGNFAFCGRRRLCSWRLAHWIYWPAAVWSNRHGPWLHCCRGLPVFRRYRANGRWIDLVASPPCLHSVDFLDLASYTEL